MHVLAVNAQRIPPTVTARWPIPKSVAIVTPGYFPEVGTAAYLLAAERVIVADVVQYSRQSRQNRCRIRTPDGAHWLTVPLRGGQHGTAHDQVELDTAASWQTRHRKAFEFNYRSSPYFDFYDRVVWEVLDSPAVHLGEISVRSVEATAKMLGTAAAVEAASDVVQRASRGSGADPLVPMSWSHVVSTVAASYPDSDVLVVEPWVRALIGAVGRTMHSIEVNTLDYEQNFPGRISGLTVLDLIFNVGPDARHLVEGGMKLAD